MGERKPNVVFVFSDQQRWDTSGAYGNPVVRTPNLDALARQGVRFDNLSPATWVMASGGQDWEYREGGSTPA